MLSNIAKYYQKLSDSVQYCARDYFLMSNVVSNIQIVSYIVK